MTIIVLIFEKVWVNIEKYRPKPLPTQGLFNPSITPKAPRTPSNTWRHHPPPPQILSRFSRPNKPQIFLLAAKLDISTPDPY